MCSTPNHGDAEVCTNCGARLKPLEVGGDSDDSEDWLDRIRDEAEEPPTPTGAEGSASKEADQGIPEPDDDFDEQNAAEVDSGSAPEAQAVEGDVPEWLQRIREKQAEEPPTSDDPAPEDALRTAAAAAQLSDEPIDAPVADEPSPDDSLRTAVTEAQAEGVEPDDLAASIGQAPEEKIIPEQESEPAPASEGDSPDWLEVMEVEEAESEEDLPHIPALIGGEEGAADEELGDLGLPDWLGDT